MLVRFQCTCDSAHATHMQEFDGHDHPLISDPSTCSNVTNLDLDGIFYSWTEMFSLDIIAVHLAHASLPHKGGTSLMQHPFNSGRD